MEAKCYLCDHEFVEGEEPWLIFEQRLCEDGTSEPSLADLLGKILGHVLDEQNAHSPYLCDSCNADVMEYESLSRRLKEVHSRMLEYYRQNGTINDLNKHLDTEVKSINSVEIVSATAVSPNLSEMLDNNGILGYFVEEIPDEEGKPSALFNLNDGHLSFGTLNDDASEVLNLPEDLSTLPNIPQDNLDSQSLIQGKEDIIIYDLYEDDTIQSDKTKDMIKMESELNFDLAIAENKDDKSAYTYESVTTQDNVVQESTSKVVSKKQGNTFLCLLCNGFFPFKRKTIEDHLQSVHQSEFYMCDMCNEGYANSKELREHCELVHLPCKTHHVCDVCFSAFNSLNQLRLHKRMHHSVKLHECQVCQKQYNSKSILNEHMNSHTGQRPYKCSECTKDFASKYTLQTHMKIHTDRERPFKCDTCDKAFFNQQNLNQHKKLHVPFKAFTCDVCLKSFATQHSLNVHLIVHSGQKPFICRICGKAFARRPEIKDHERIHTGEKPFKCDLCPSAFSQRSNLTSHKKSTHLNEKMHHCNQCGRSYKRRRLLHYHVLAVHTGERPFQCETCGAGFVYPEHFKKHLLIHSGKKPFACEVCGKQFNSRDNRNAHRFVHSDKKPYECMECGAGFMRKPLLLAHMKRTKHVNDTIIVNQPQFTIHQGENINNLNDCSNEENSVLVNEDNDAVPTLDILEDVSVPLEEDNGDNLTILIGKGHLSEHNVDDVKYLEFDDIIVDNQTLTWVDVNPNNSDNSK